MMLHDTSLDIIANNDSNILTGGSWSGTVLITKRPSSAQNASYFKVHDATLYLALSCW